jgi:5-methylcytosine-specific restriction endonuclease McrA
VATHGYYSTAHWRALRKAALRRDGYRCTVAGCGAPATHVDHIATRPRSLDPTPFDRLDNLRSLCGAHDAQIKERRNGERGRGGRPVVRGCDADGWPFSQPGWKS